MTLISKPEQLSKLLKELSSYCDTGFALAIHIRYTRPSLLFRTYGQDWIDHYSEMGFHLADPVVHWGLTNTGWVQWSELMKQDAEGVLKAAVSHGLTNGWTYSTGPATSRTITGITRSGDDFSKAERAHIAKIFDEVHDLTEGVESYSPEEMDVLRQLI